MIHIMIGGQPLYRIPKMLKAKKHLFHVVSKNGWSKYVWGESVVHLKKKFAGCYISAPLFNVGFYKRS